MGINLRRSNAIRIWHKSSGLIIVAILLIGIISSIITGIYTDRLSRQALEQRATDISYALMTDQIKSLTGTPDDLSNEPYLDIKQTLEKIRSSDESLRYVYLFDISQANSAMLVDSESLDSNHSIVPGKKIEHSTSTLGKLKTTTQSITEGPAASPRGTSITSFAPIRDRTTNEIIAILALEKSSERFYLNVAGFAVLPILLVIPALLALIQDRRVRRKEEAILQLRSKFVSVASHELRSPLSGMLWALESLLKPEVKNLTIEQQVILLDMYQSTEESLATINEILDMSALEKNKPQQFAIEPVEIGNIIKNATKTLRLSAHERGIKFAFVGNWNGDDSFTMGDRSALKRLFMNLITNAIKYGRDDSTISIRLSRKDDMHIIAIEDHGIGIPMEEQKKVLSGYYRASNAQKTQKAGTGLGLLLAQRVTEQHGGSLKIVSKEGIGTTVYVSLPNSQQTKK